MHLPGRHEWGMRSRESARPGASAPLIDSSSLRPFPLVNTATHHNFAILAPNALLSSPRTPEQLFSKLRIQFAKMPATVLPQKRAFGEASNARRNIVASPSTSKKRRLEPISSSPAKRLPSSQNGNKLGSSQPKSTFESEVLEKLSQDMSDRKQNNTENDQSWARPPVPASFSPHTEKLCFQQIEAEEGTLSGGIPTVKLFGVTENGNSVMLHVKDFKHYFYVQAPSAFAESDCAAFRVYLESVMASHQPLIHSVQFAMRESIMGFQNNTRHPFLKITVTDPKFIGRVRTAVSEGNANWKRMWKYQDKIMTYDNIQYVLRFMVDCQVC